MAEGGHISAVQTQGCDEDFGIAHGSAVQAYGLDADRRMGELLNETLAEVDCGLGADRTSGSARWTSAKC